MTGMKVTLTAERLVGLLRFAEKHHGADHAARWLLEEFQKQPEEFYRCFVDAVALLIRVRKGLKVSREELHSTYNGGWQDEPERRAFHHGMDTVMNIIEPTVKLLEEVDTV